MPKHWGLNTCHSGHMKITLEWTTQRWEGWEGWEGWPPFLITSHWDLWTANAALCNCPALSATSRLDPVVTELYYMDPL